MSGIWTEGGRSWLKRALGSAWWLGVAVLGLPSGVAAQGTGVAPDTGRVFVGASVISTTRPAGEQDYHYVTPMFGGTTTDIVVTAGFFLVPHASFAVEISRVGTLSGPFNFNHFLHGEATATETETMVGLLVRVHPMKSRVRVEPLGGMFLSVECITFTDRRDFSSPFYPTETVTPLPDASGTNIFFGLGGGADVVADLTRHLAVTASFRFVGFRNRYVPPAAVADATSVGIGNQTFQAGGGLRWTFR